MAIAVAFQRVTWRVVVAGLLVTSTFAVALAARDFPIQKFVGGSPHLNITPRYGRSGQTSKWRTVLVNGIGTVVNPFDHRHPLQQYYSSFRVPETNDEEDDIIDILRDLYDKTFGDLGHYWIGPNIPMHAKYAKIKIGDVFDFYTDSDGELKFPPWTSFKFVVDQYLDGDRVPPAACSTFDRTDIELLDANGKTSVAF